MIQYLNIYVCVLIYVCVRKEMKLTKLEHYCFISHTFFFNGYIVQHLTLFFCVRDIQFLMR